MSKVKMTQDEIDAMNGLAEKISAKFNSTEFFIGNNADRNRVLFYFGKVIEDGNTVKAYALEWDTAVYIGLSFILRARKIAPSEKEFKDYYDSLLDRYNRGEL